MIGGVDLILKGRTRSDDADLILRAVRRAWPSACFQRADAENAAPLSAVRFPVDNMDEFFVYRDAACLESWQTNGASTENEDTMIHVVVSPQEITIIVDRYDGPLAVLAEEIFEALRAKRRMPRTTLRVEQVGHDYRT
jgi:hypothetical protein